MVKLKSERMREVGPYGRLLHQAVKTRSMLPPLHIQQNVCRLGRQAYGDQLEALHWPEAHLEALIGLEVWRS